MADYSVPDVLAVKVHTSGLFRTDLSIDDAGQPWIMSMGACLFTGDGVVTNAFGHIVKSDGRTTMENAAAVHGLTPQIASKVGIDERRVYGPFVDMLRTAPPRGLRVVTFNDFDRRVIDSGLARFAMKIGYGANKFDAEWLARPITAFVDIQKPACQIFCKFPPPFEGGDYRFPSLDEAAEALLGRAPVQGRRDALTDVLIIKDLYVDLVRRRLLVIEELGAAPVG